MKPGKVPFSAKLRPEMKPELGDDPKGRGRMLLPTPMLVAEEISAVPKGHLLTVSELRSRLARRFQADFTCPLMSGIFFNLVAGAAEEQIAAGQKPLAPYWRVTLDNGTLSPKTPYGPERQAEHLRGEGHTIGVRRSKLRVDSAAAARGS
ncbi:MAG: hypothetical protein AB7O66_03360 [Limisphaerales bacterium]